MKISNRASRIIHGMLAAAIMFAPFACTQKVTRNYGSTATMPTNTFAATIHEVEVVDGETVLDMTEDVDVTAYQSKWSYNYAGITMAVTDVGAVLDAAYVDSTFEFLGFVFDVTMTGSLAADGTGTMTIKEQVENGSLYVFTYTLGVPSTQSAEANSRPMLSQLIANRLSEVQDAEINKINAGRLNE